MVIHTRLSTDGGNYLVPDWKSDCWHDYYQQLVFPISLMAGNAPDHFMVLEAATFSFFARKRLAVAGNWFLMLFCSRPFL